MKLILYGKWVEIAECERATPQQVADQINAAADWMIPARVENGCVITPLPWPSISSIQVMHVA